MCSRCVTLLLLSESYQAVQLLQLRYSWCDSITTHPSRFNFKRSMEAVPPHPLTDRF